VSRNTVTNVRSSKEQSPLWSKPAHSSDILTFVPMTNSSAFVASTPQIFGRNAKSETEETHDDDVERAGRRSEVTKSRRLTGLFWRSTRRLAVADEWAAVSGIKKPGAMAGLNTILSLFAHTFPQGGVTRRFADVASATGAGVV
jgi:hypothetical protein